MVGDIQAKAADTQVADHRTLVKVEFQAVAIRSQMVADTQAKVEYQTATVAVRLCQEEMPTVSASTEWWINPDGSCLTPEITMQHSCSRSKTLHVTKRLREEWGSKFSIPL